MTVDEALQEGATCAMLRERMPDLVGDTHRACELLAAEVHRLRAEVEELRCESDGSEDD